MAVTGIQAELLAIARPALPVADLLLVHSSRSQVPSASSVLGLHWMPQGRGEVKETGSLA